MEKCAYCNNFLNNSSVNKKEIYNTRIIESDNFVVLPTLGMIIPGWLLLVTKKHVLNMSVIPSEWYSEIEDLISHTIDLISSNYPVPILFEHGPDNPNLSKTGACIDHAHFHFIPSSKNVKFELQKNHNLIEIRTIDDLNSMGKEIGSYLFLQDQNGARYITEAKEIPSQYIRKIVAKLHEKNYEWDWKAFSHINNIAETLNAFSIVNGDK